MKNLIQEYSIYARYFAPRGRERLLFLGEQISQRHLHFNDRLVGVIGDAGSGKSSLIKGMFPGLELTNDDDQLDARKIMQIRDLPEDYEHTTTFHIDMRFQMAFTQMHEIVDFVRGALECNRRIIVEHFDLLFPALRMNADLLVGIGEEILVIHPTVFGPKPKVIYDIVHTSLFYRKMAHTVEDITIQLLLEEFGISRRIFYSSDITDGFVLGFNQRVDIDFDKLAQRINERLEENLPIRYHDERHIMVGDDVVTCSGPRLHLRNTSEVKDFKLVKRLIRDIKTNTFYLVGLFGHEEEDVENLNTLQ